MCAITKQTSNGYDKILNRVLFDLSGEKDTLLTRDFAREAIDEVGRA